MLNCAIEMRKHSFNSAQDYYLSLLIIMFDLSTDRFDLSLGLARVLIYSVDLDLNDGFNNNDSYNIAVSVLNLNLNKSLLDY